MKINLFRTLFLFFCLSIPSHSAEKDFSENGLTISENRKEQTLRVANGKQVFDFKCPVRGNICTALDVEEWDTIFIGIQTKPDRFEILAVSKKNGTVSLLDMDSHYFADDHIFPLRSGDTITIAPLTFRGTPNGKCVFSYPVVTYFGDGDPHRTCLSIEKLEEGKFEVRSNR